MRKTSSSLYESAKRGVPEAMMNRAFRVREGATSFDETVWGTVIFYNEELAAAGLTELTREDMNAAIAAGDVEEVEYDQEEADRVLEQIKGVLSDDPVESFFTTDKRVVSDVPIYDSEDRVGVGGVIIDFVERARDEAEMFSLIIHVDARLGALRKYGPDDSPTALMLNLRISTPIATPDDDDPLAVSDYVTELAVKLGRSSIDANRDLADDFCGWVTRGLAGQGCVVDFTGLD